MCLAIPGKLITIESTDDPSLRSGSVEFGGSRREVSLAFTPEAEIGDFVLVHVGFALSVVDDAEAQLIFEDLRRMADLSETQEPSP